MGTPQKFGETKLAAKTTTTTGSGDVTSTIAGVIPSVIKSRIQKPNASSGSVSSPAQLARSISSMSKQMDDTNRAMRNVHDYGAKVIEGCEFPMVGTTQGQKSLCTFSISGAKGYKVESLILLSGFTLTGDFDGKSITVTATWVLPTVSGTVSPGSFTLVHW